VTGDGVMTVFAVMTVAAVGVTIASFGLPARAMASRRGV
jgi:hypothetical protein